MLKKRRTSVITLSMCIMLTIGFIWSNSIQPGTVSNQSSGKILNLIQWLFGGRFDTYTLNIVVRKSAHFIEFALLGAEIISLMLMLKKHQLWLVLFSGLSVATIDEFIQSFSGRTDSVSDVVLDFCGVLFGVLFVYAVCYFIKKLRSRH